MHLPNNWITQSSPFTSSATTFPMRSKLEDYLVQLFQWYSRACDLIGCLGKPQVESMKKLRTSECPALCSLIKKFSNAIYMTGTILGSLFKRATLLNLIDPLVKNIFKAIMIVQNTNISY